MQADEPVGGDDQDPVVNEPMLIPAGGEDQPVEPMEEEEDPGNIIRNIVQGGDEQPMGRDCLSFGMGPCAQGPMCQWAQGPMGQRAHMPKSP